MRGVRDEVIRVKKGRAGKGDGLISFFFFSVVKEIMNKWTGVMD